MERTDFSAHRILIVGAKTPTTGLLRSVLGIVGVTRLMQIQDTARALELLAMENFTAVFCSHDIALFQDMTFAVAARRRHGMLNPTIPIFMLQPRARRRDVETARDTGVTDVLTTPISPRTIMTKLKAAELSPRPFIVAPEFFGPDRRARNRAPWSGNDRRQRLAKKTKVDFHHI